MAFEYRDSRGSPAAGSIAELMLRRGEIAAQQANAVANAQARAAEVGGQAWAGAANQIGGAVSGAIQQATDPRRKIEAQQLEAGGVALGEQKRAIAMRSALSQAITTTPMVDEGGVSVYDIPSITKNLPPEFRANADEVVKHLGGINDAFRQEQAAKMAVVQRGATSLLASGSDPALTLHFIDTLEKNHSYPSETLDQFRQFIQSNPDKTGMILQQFVQPQKPEIVPEGGTAIDPVTHQPVFAGTPKPPTEAELALKASGGDAAGAMSLLKPPPNRTAEQDDQRYRDIQAKLTQRIPVAPPDLAWAQGYEKQKTLGVDTSASAAATRQANAIAAQTAQQERAQTFTEAQAGRKELTDKVETPFRQAQQSAQELRDLVHAAQAGNKEAASLQSLQATMSVVRANGLNRLNQAEMKLPEGAGNVWDRVAGKVGKLTSGQPIDASLQHDLLDLADLMEKGAYNRYQTSHKDITSRYKLTDEKPAAPPASYFSVVAPDGHTYTFPSQEKLDAFKTKAGIK